ncbi:unnamed protein product [Ectocarpus sp. CCAP 1310/34]|nr:unnamed protein product [Ectocarpus sp. CCAP 1310/34]
MEAQQDTGAATRRGSSRESRNTTGTGSGLASGNAILVDMTRLADVLGCGRDELLHSLRKEATSEAEGVAVDGTRTSPTLDQLDVPAMYPPSGVRQALMTTVSRPANASGKAEDGEVPRPLWLLGGSGGKTIVELVLLNLVRSGIDRVVIVVGGKDGDKIRDAVSRTRAVSAGKITIEFLEDPTDPSRQFHAKSILRARGAFDSPFLFMTSDHLYHPGLLHQLAGQELGEDGGCVLVEDAAGPSSLRDMAPTAVFVRRAEADSASAALPSAGETGSAEKQASRRVMAIGRREQGKRQKWDGVECGAILLSPEIFDTLSDLGKRRKYFTLADGLDFMAGKACAVW